MKRPCAIAVLALFAGFAGCGGPSQPAYGPGPGAGPAPGPGGKPGWVDGRGSRYTDIEYLTGVGRGPGRSQCEDDALAALAKIFNSQIQQVSQDWQGYFSKVSSQSGSVKVEAMAVSQLTRVSTDKVIRGARIAEHWEGEGTHHCLATLERMPAARSLREEIGRLDVEIQAQVKRGDEGSTPTSKFMAYARAMEILQEREAQNVDLRIIDQRGAGMPPPIGWAELVAKFSGSRSKIKVGLKITGTEAAKIQTCLAEELTKTGIDVVEGSSDVDMMIHGQLKYAKAGYINGSEMVRADINLRIADVENGKTLAAFSHYVKEGRPELQQSVQLAVTKLCQEVIPKLGEQIRSSFRK
jgi:hypothetical protein